jgi:hypothetical protein
MKEAFDSSLPSATNAQVFNPSDFVSFALDSEIIGPNNNFPLQVNRSVLGYCCTPRLNNLRHSIFSGRPLSQNSTEKMLARVETPDTVIEDLLTAPYCCLGEFSSKSKHTTHPKCAHKAGVAP